jgi:hypothetical protein
MNREDIKFIELFCDYYEVDQVSLTNNDINFMLNQFEFMRYYLENKIKENKQ